MIRKALVVLALAIVALCYSAPAMADNIHLCDINQFTTCNAGNAIQVQSGTTQAWAFGTANSSETLYIAVQRRTLALAETLRVARTCGQCLALALHRYSPTSPALLARSNWRRA